MATLKLRVDYVDSGDWTRPDRPTAYTVDGFKCGSMAIVSPQPDHRDRWVVHLVPAGSRLTRIPNSFASPEEALQFLQRWVDAQTEPVARLAS